MYRLIAYIKFLLRSGNQHGVHSPFVYKLLTQCLYKTGDKPAFKSIRSYIKALGQDHRLIFIEDGGTGRAASKKRKVSDIARNAGISTKRALLLNRLTSYLNIKTALELGTSLGIRSRAITAGNPVKLTSLEACPETARLAREYFEKFGMHAISLKVGDFQELLSREHRAQEIKGALPGPGHQEKEHSQDLIYFERALPWQDTSNYFKELLPLSHNDSVFIFEDVHRSKEMEETWEAIKAHPRVRVSIDSFFWGLIFFREEQEKEHFTLRL